MCFFTYYCRFLYMPHSQDLTFCCWMRAHEATVPNSPTEDRLHILYEYFTLRRKLWLIAEKCKLLNKYFILVCFFRPFHPVSTVYNEKGSKDSMLRLHSFMSTSFLYYFYHYYVAVLVDMTFIFRRYQLLESPLSSFLVCGKSMEINLICFSWHFNISGI